MAPMPMCRPAILLDPRAPVVRLCAAAPGALAVFVGWLVLIFYERKVLLIGWCWLVLDLCEREILLMDTAKMKRTEPLFTGTLPIARDPVCVRCCTAE